MTVTEMTATPESARIAELTELLHDLRSAGWTAQLEAAHAEMLAVTAAAVLAA